MKNLCALTVVMLFISGCSTVTYRAGGNFTTYFDNQKTVAVMPPDVKINQLSAGGIPELMDEWSETAKENVLNSIRNELSLFSKIRVISIDEKSLDESYWDFLKEENGLYSAVAASIINHTYNPVSIFKHKIRNFDYTLGSEVSKLSGITDADTLLFCSGTNYIWTAGRVCLATFGMLLGAATGVCVVPTAGPESLSLSLVDIKSGDVIWFDYIPMQGDLRDPDTDNKLIKRLFNSFPKKWK